MTLGTRQSVTGGPSVRVRAWSIASVGNDGSAAKMVARYMCVSHYAFACVVPIITIPIALTLTV